LGIVEDAEEDLVNGYGSLRHVGAFEQKERRGELAELFKHGNRRK